MATDAGAAGKSLEERLRKESSGWVNSKLNLPGAQDYRELGWLNILPGTPRPNYSLPNKQGLFDSKDGRPLFERLDYINLHSSYTDEFLDRVPVGSKEEKRLTIAVPVTTDKFVAGPFHFGKKREERPYGLNVVTFGKSGLSDIHYSIPAARGDQIGGTLLRVTMAIRTPDSLADEFMSRAKKQPDDAQRILSDGLFPRLFVDKHEYIGGNARDHVVQATPIGPGVRNGVMHFRNLSPDELQSHGFEFGRPYLSMKNQDYERWRDVFQKARTGGAGYVEQLKQTKPRHFIFEELEKQGIVPQPPVFDNPEWQGSIINPQKLHYTPS